MALAVRSHGVSPGANTKTIIITKPTGLAAGDLMIAHLTWGLSSVSTVAPSGWTLLESAPTSGAIPVTGEAWYKVADSTDAAASTFTFTNPPLACSNIGAITAITGFNSSNPINVHGSATTPDDTSANVTTPDLTPTVAGTLLLFLVSVGDNLTTSGYSIPNNNPSWTEEYDINTIAGTDCCAAMAYGLYTATTNTGVGSATISLATESAGIFVMVEPFVAVPSISGWGIPQNQPQTNRTGVTAY